MSGHVNRVIQSPNHLKDGTPVQKPVKTIKPKKIKKPESITEELVKEEVKTEVVATLEGANKETLVEVTIETEPEPTEEPESSKKPKMKNWPEDSSELLPYNDIIFSFKDVLRQGYRLMRKDEVKGFDYHGFNIGKKELESNPSPRARLSQKFLEYEKKFGHTLLDVVLNMVFLMGVEQGRRAERRDSKPMETLLETLEIYREKNKDQRIRIDELEITLELKEKEPNLPEEDFLVKLQEGVLSRRNKRIEELKAELQLDASRSAFQFKTPVRVKFKELEALAKTFSKETCTEEQWNHLLEERGWTNKEWKDRCKKKSIKTDFS